MTCGNCGHTWDLLRAHVIRVERTPEGCRELVLCPKCGRVESIIKPDLDACEDD
jgi:NAD-dependent SIR2 family protein deacetylase